MPLGGVLGGLAVTALGLSPALLVAGIAYAITTMAPTRVPSFRVMDRADVVDTRTLVATDPVGPA